MTDYLGNELFCVLFQTSFEKEPSENLRQVSFLRPVLVDELGACV